MQDYVSLIKLLGHSTRIRILWLLLYAKQELCVCELVDVLQENQFNVSRHLRQLDESGLLTSCKKGKWVMYWTKDNLDEFKFNLLQAIQNIPESYFKDDARRLHERLAKRVEGECVIGLLPPE